MCSIDYDDYWDAYADKFVVAKKEHPCTACGVRIQPGAQYLKHAHLYDGEWYRENACFACAAALHEFNEAHAVGTSPRMLEETLRNCIGDNDDKEAEWRPWLAGLLKRFRTSPARRSPTWKRYVV